MIIINQDRDQFIYADTLENFHTMPVIHDNILYGINLYIGSFFLGTFDSVDEAIKEIETITGCQKDYYAVSGYSAWNEWETVVECMTEADE